MANTFTYSPTIASQKSHEPRVNRVDFGNGYYQLVGDGINSNLEKWNLIFIVEDTEKQAIEDFFLNEGGYNYFNWTSDEAGAVQKQYICSSWNIQPMGASTYQISAIFEEFPGLTS